MEGDGGNVVASWTRATVEFAKAVMALWRYLGFLAVSGDTYQSRMKKRYRRLVIFPIAACGVR